LFAVDTVNNQCSWVN